MPKLSSPAHTATGNNDRQRKNMAEEAALQAQSYQQAYAKGDQHTAPQVISAAHKNTPCI